MFVAGEVGGIGFFCFKEIINRIGFWLFVFLCFGFILGIRIGSTFVLILLRVLFLI